MKLIDIKQDGSISESIELSDKAASICKYCTSNYESGGYQRPWIAYLAYEEKIKGNGAIGAIIGTCAFKSPPVNGKVEIAYFTFPDYENRGFATKMASNLIKIAQAKEHNIIISAQTLTEENASTTILKKLGFEFAGEIEHPEDGLVWDWQLPKKTGVY